MKILIPTVRAERVGTAVSYAQDRLYDCPNRPNIYGSVVETPLIERKLAAKVVFDRDLRVAQRLTGVAQLALCAVALPVLLVMAATYVVGETLGNGLEALARMIRKPMDAAGVTFGRGIRAEFVRLARKVIAK